MNHGNDCAQFNRLFTNQANRSMVAAFDGALESNLRTIDTPKAATLRNGVSNETNFRVAHAYVQGASLKASAHRPLAVFLAPGASASAPKGDTHGAQPYSVLRGRDRTIPHSFRQFSCRSNRRGLSQPSAPGFSRFISVRHLSPAVSARRSLSCVLPPTGSAGAWFADPFERIAA